VKNQLKDLYSKHGEKDNRNRKISIFGLGYIGCVLSACFAKKGFEVIGVDIDSFKIESINNGISPIIEPQLNYLIHEVTDKGNLRATNDVNFAINNTNISMICVGTPSLPNGDIDYTYIERVIIEIANALLIKNSNHIIIIRSTILPGTIDSIIKPTLLELCGKVLFQKVKLCHNPEFLREGSAISDFFKPPKTVIGVYEEQIGQYLMSLLYDNIPGEKIITDINTAETVKYVDNTFHALKVSFANEVGIFCKSLGIDSYKVMEIFCKDRKLNLSPYYLKPGKPFGGSCLFKDLSALIYRAKRNDLELPVIYNILLSNEVHKKNVLQLITSFDRRNIGIIGISFKENTDDLRYSPTIEIIESLIGKGYNVSIFDENISLAKIYGSNRDYIVKHIPHISSLLVDDLNNLIESSEIIVIANKEKELLKKLSNIQIDKIIIDLVRIDGLANNENYYGLVW